MSQLDYGNPPATRKATFSVPSVLSLVIVIASFNVARPLWAAILAIAAMVLGLIGVLIALLPGIRGGLLSMLSIFLAVISIIAAIVHLIA